MRALMRIARNVIGGTIVSASALVAQQSPATAVIEPDGRRAVVETIARLVEDNYVIADAGARAAAHVRAKLVAGAYDRLTDPGQFADYLTKDLQSVISDKHVRVNVRAPGDEEVQRGGWEAYQAHLNRKLARENYGLAKLELLDGNIGYRIFSYNARVFATSARAFDSLGEAYFRIETASRLSRASANRSSWIRAILTQRPCSGDSANAERRCRLHRSVRWKHLWCKRANGSPAAVRRRCVRSALRQQNPA